MGTTRKSLGEAASPRRTRRSSAAVEVVGAATALVTELDHDAIAARAYELYEASGRQHGRDQQHWLAAEAEILARVSAPRS